MRTTIPNAAPWRALVLTTAAMAVGFLLVRPVVNLDVWWHLACGEWMVAHRAIPRVDVWSWTAHGTPFLNHEWLLQLLQYAAYRFTGITGIIGLKCLVLGLLFGVVAWRLKRQEAPALVILAGLLLAAAAGHTAFYERADHWSVLLLCFCLQALDADGEIKGVARFSKRWALCMPLWANLHGGWILASLGFISAAAGLWMSGRRIPRNAIGWMLLGLAFSLLNPYGIEMHRSFWHSLRWPVELLREYATPFRLRYAGFYWVMGIVLGSFVCRRRAWSFTATVHFTLALAFGILAGRYLRFVHWAAFILVPVVWGNIRVWPAGRSAISRWNKKPLIWQIAFGMVGAAALWAAKGIEGGVDTRRSYAIRPVCEFIRDQKIPGPFYNDYGFGSYWVWFFKGNPPVFQDGRNVMVDGYREVSRLTLLSKRTPEGWRALQERYPYSAALVEYPPSRFDASPSTLRHYFPKPMWALVYWDDQGLLYLRRNPQNRAVIAAHEFSAFDPDAPYAYEVERWNAQPQLRPLILSELVRSMRLHPDSRKVREWGSVFSPGISDVSSPGSVRTRVGPS